MKRKRIGWAVAVLVGLCLAGNLLAGGWPAAMVDAPRSRCVRDGWPAQDTKMLRYGCDDGR
jgi:hypothetical protein